jgi:DNA end-binding protein Ku
MRPIKSTTIQCGLVVLPVKIYPSTQDKTVGLFNQIHAVCGSRIKMPKTCPKCNRAVEAGELVKGYSLGKVKGGEEKFIYVTDQELENLPLETAQNIAIDAFVPAEKIADPRWFESCYFLSPEDTAVRPFVLFARTMEALNSVGIAKVALKEQKEHLCVVRPFAGMLMLQTLHWADELRDYTEIMVSANVSEKEMELAKSLITAMKGDRFSIISRRVPESSAGTYRCQAGREVYRLACCTEGRLNGCCGCLISIAEGGRGRS